MDSCALCDEKLNKLENQSEIVEYKTSNGIKNILVEGLSFYKCQSCGETFYSPQDIIVHDNQLEKALEKDRKSKGLLTAREIKQIRSKWELSQTQLEVLLNISPKNVAKWETYRADQSKTVDKTLRTINDNYCCFLAFLTGSPLVADKKMTQKHLNKIDYLTTIEFIKKIHPDFNEKDIALDLIFKIEEILEKALTENIKIEQQEIKLKTAV